MPNHDPWIDEDPDAVESAQDKKARELHEAYRQKFGEWPPMFVIGPNPLERIQEALRTGEPILEDLPPGCEA